MTDISLSAYEPSCPSVGRSVDWLVGWLVGWSVGWMVWLS